MRDRQSRTWVQGGLIAGLLAVALLMLGALADIPKTPAKAQFWGWGGSEWGPPRPSRPVGREPRRRAPSPRAQEGGFGFPFIFGLPDDRSGRGAPNRRRRDTARDDRAPPPAKREVAAAQNVLVLGDTLADWLGYGLEEAGAEGNAFGVVRRPRAGSSLIRNDPRDYDWVQGVRDWLAADKADVVVMMVGLNDRHAIRERVGSSAGQTAGEVAENRRSGTISHEFRSEKWVELYGKRVEEVISALKAKQVPVIWVGLPPVRNPRIRADHAFINDLVKERVERTGIIFVDVWEGFVDENGEYSQYGPDVIGQTRLLRSADGVHFTRAGARKLAHYVDREIRRLLAKETPVALPTPATPAVTAPTAQPSGDPTGRPASGPVVRLTGGATAPEPLLGRPQDAQVTDPAAVKVLVKGEPPPPQPGRADSFAWPPPQPVADNDVVAPPPAVAAISASAPPAVTQPRPLPRIGQRSRPKSASRAAPPAQ